MGLALFFTCGAAWAQTGLPPMPLVPFASPWHRVASAESIAPGVVDGSAPVSVLEQPAGELVVPPAEVETVPGGLSQFQPDVQDYCASCENDEPWHWQVLPQGVIYQSYMAGLKEPRIAAYWSHDENWGWLWDPVLGGRAGLFRYGNSDPNWPEGWELDIEGAVFARLDPIGDSTPLIATDYRIGLPMTYGINQWQFKLGYYHISSHMGDEFLLENPGVERINYVRDGFNLGVGYFWTPALRLYGEFGYAPSTNDGAEPIELQFGFDWAQARNTGFKGGPFLAMNGYLREEVDYGGNFVVQFGWMWRQYARGSNFRIGGQYVYGKSDQFEFFRQSESRMGWGIWYDF